MRIFADVTRDGSSRLANVAVANKTHSYAFIKHVISIKCSANA